MDSLHVTPSRDSNKLQTELAERTAEISRLRDQMSQQQTELEQVCGKLKSHEGLKDSLDAASHELVGNLISSWLTSPPIHCLSSNMRPLFCRLIVRNNTYSNFLVCLIFSLFGLKVQRKPIFRLWLWIMCNGQVSINTLDRIAQSTSHQSVKSQVIFTDVPSSVNQYIGVGQHSANYRPTDCWLSVDQASIEMLMECWSREYM